MYKFFVNFNCNRKINRNIKNYDPFTEAIKELHKDKIKSYHYALEFDMINKIVIGMSAKEYKSKNDIASNVSLFKILNEHKKMLYEKLKEYDILLMRDVQDIEKRKEMLRIYSDSIKPNGI